MTNEEIAVIKIFTGDDRVRILDTVQKELGEDYEVFEGAELSFGDLLEIFQGATLFAGFEGRRVLIRDLGENKEIFKIFSEKIEEFLKTEAKVILFETKIDKRLLATKKIIQAGVKIQEFKLSAKIDSKAVFEIYDVALRNGREAVKRLEKIQSDQDPYMFFGLLVSQAVKRFERSPKGEKETKILKELAKVDMDIKSTAFEPWTIIKGFLVRLSSL